MVQFRDSRIGVCQTHKRQRLGAHVVDVDVDASVNVVEQVPPDVIGILIDDKVVRAVPAPIGANRPIPGGNFKVETTGQPETVVIAIKAFDAVAIRWPKMLEASVLERMVEVIPFVIRTVVPVPTVIVYVRRSIHMAGHVTLWFGFGVMIVPPLRWGWDSALVGARKTLSPLLSVFLATLRKNRKCRD